MSKKWDIRKDKPLVSIGTVTYNQAGYIRECLDSLLMQETNFSFEMIVHDDASTDGTAEIVREYAEKYPHIITPIFQTENQWSKYSTRIAGIFLFPKARGKYIALCEGDDFWTDTNKLQFQVNFLEENPEFIGTSHNVNYFNDPDNEVNMAREFYGASMDSIFTLQDVMNGASVAGAYCSFVFRNFFTKELLSKVRSPDFPGMNHIELSIWLAIQGNIYYSKNVMATHRYIMKKESSNWKSQSLSRNQLGVLYDLFPRLEKASFEELGVKIDLHKCKYAHFYQMVKKAFTSFEKSDFEILMDTWKKSENRLRYFFLIFYSLTFDVVRSTRKVFQQHLWRK